MRKEEEQAEPVQSNARAEILLGGIGSKSNAEKPVP